MTIDSVTGEISWTPTISELGTHSVTVTASDLEGLSATQSYSLEVRIPNTAPVFTSTPFAAVSAGGNYRYDVLATDTEDAVSYSLVSAPADVKIGNINGILFWRTDLANVGDHPITIRATDDRGLFTDQSYTLSVTPDATPPLVTVALSNTLINVGQTIRINVAATDDVEVLGLVLEIDGVVQTLDANNGIFYTPTSGGLPNIVATATDTSGNVGTGSPNPLLRVLDPNDTEAPFVEITSPATGSIITYRPCGLSAVRGGPRENPTKGRQKWSGRWDSNPRLQPWQGCALPLSYARVLERDRFKLNQFETFKPSNFYT